MNGPVNGPLCTAVHRPMHRAGTTVCTLAAGWFPAQAVTPACTPGSVSCGGLLVTVACYTAAFTLPRSHSSGFGDGSVLPLHPPVCLQPDRGKGPAGDAHRDRPDGSVTSVTNPIAAAGSTRRHLRHHPTSCAEVVTSAHDKQTRLPGPRPGAADAQPKPRNGLLGTAPDRPAAQVRHPPQWPDHHGAEPLKTGGSAGSKLEQVSHFAG